MNLTPTNNSEIKSPAAINKKALPAKRVTEVSKEEEGMVKMKKMVESLKEVLEEIKSDEILKAIPVIVMTISKAEEDILKSYKLHANAYIVKPIELNQFMNVVRSIEEFWLTIVKLPPKIEN